MNKTKKDLLIKNKFEISVKSLSLNNGQLLIYAKKIKKEKLMEL